MDRLPDGAFRFLWLGERFASLLFERRKLLSGRRGSSRYPQEAGSFLRAACYLLAGSKDLGAHSRYFVKIAPRGRSREACVRVVLVRRGLRPWLRTKCQRRGVRRLRSEFAVRYGPIGNLEWLGCVAAWPGNFLR